jgi:xanthine dehydrogenase accessory factor
LKSIYEKISEPEEKKTALCIITSSKGSTPRKTGTKMIVYEDESIFGTIGGGYFEKQVIRDAIEVIKTSKPRQVKYDLVHQLGMCCGGTLEVYIEPVMKKNTLYIFGAGHTGQALAKYALDFEFEIFLIDDRKEYIEQCHLPDVNKMNLGFSDAIRFLPFNKQTYIAILTYDHRIDREIAAYCCKKEFAYLGMIGSRRKAEMTKKLFIESGAGTEVDFNKIHTPIGMDINAESPEEIAVSIISEIIKIKNKISV